jgi:hypothetical protein
MNVFVYCTTHTAEQTKAILADLKRAGFASPHVSALTADTDTPEPDAMLRSGSMRVCVHAINPNQRNAAQDIFHQHDADDITTGSEPHATTH